MKKVIILFLFVALIGGVAFPNELFTQQQNIIYVDAEIGDNSNLGTREEPVKTIGYGLYLLSKLSNPRRLIIKAGVYTNYNGGENRISLNGWHGEPGMLIEIEGADGVVMIEGWTEPCDPIQNPKYYPFEIISVLYSSYVSIKNIHAVGGGEQTLKIESSHNLNFDGVHATRSQARGAFLCGGNPIPHDIIFRNCVFGDTLNAGDSTHGFYASAGQYSPDGITCKNIFFFDCEFWANMRCGLQFNGNFENIWMDRCVFRHNHVAGLTVMSAKNVYIANSIFYDNNRNPIVFYVYYDEGEITWKPDKKENVIKWIISHPPIHNVIVENNTMYGPPWAFWWDNLHQDDPTIYAGIKFALEDDVNKWLNLYGFPNYPEFTYFKIRNNIIANHSGLFIETSGERNLDATGNEFYSNLSYDYNGGPMYVVNNGPVITLQNYQATHENWHDNKEGEPMFVACIPTDTINGNKPPGPHDYTVLLPLYKDDRYKDFHILRESTAINIGSIILSVNRVDFDKLVRKVGGSVDAGAYEFRRYRDKTR